jgi:adenylyltransferase/sulfurtransferase
VSATQARAAAGPLVAAAGSLDPAEADRYSRHLLLPGFGGDAQRRLKNARVLVVGAGGLGSPVLLYLAAAGVGTLGIVDDDRVETSNLQRQVIHGTGDVGRLKVDSARETIESVNPLVRVETHPYRLMAENAVGLVERYDLVVDGADNFATRYLVSDAAELAGKPCVWGSILQFGAQVSVFWAGHGPTYRDLYPDSPPPESAPSCGEAGVLGMLCGAAGSVMAAEAVKLITGTGRSLLGRLALFDIGEATWRELAIPAPAVSRRPVRYLAQPAESCAPAIVDAEVGVDVEAPRTITVEELREVLAAARPESSRRPELIDVREPEEYAAVHLPGSRSWPLSILRSRGVPAGLHPEAEIVLLCKAGPRAELAAEIVRGAGFGSTRVLVGGIDEWLRSAGGAAAPGTQVAGSR